MKRHLITLLKIAVSLGIIAYLVWDVKSKQSDVFSNLLHQSKHWGFLGLALVFCTSAVLLTMIRWHFLIRALEIPTKLKSTFRIAFVGYFFNLAPLGIAGGDLIRMMMLAEGHKNSKAKSIASVVLDRAIGLYMLFVVASVVIFVTGFHPDNEVIVGICRATWIIALVGGAVIATVMIPAVTEGRFAKSLEKMSGVGPAISSLLEAVRMYRRSPGVLFLACILTVGVHSFFAIGVYMIARGLPGPDHSLGTHLVIMPLSASSGVVPFPMGPFEWVLEYFYHHIPLAAGTIAVGQGLVVALGYRLITVLIASVGAICYFRSRREVAKALSEAKTEREASPVDDGPNIAMCEEQSAA